MIAFFAEYLISKNIINCGDRDWFIYSFSKRLYSILSYTVIIIALVSEFKLSYIIIFICTFSYIRKYSGGYHAEKILQCFILSLLIVFLGLLFAETLYKIDAIFTMLIYVVSVFVLLHFSPVNHPNMDLTQNEYVAVKKKLKNHILILSVLIIATHNFFEMVSYLLLSAIFLACITVIVAKLIGQEVKL